MRRQFISSLGLDVAHTQELGDRLLAAIRAGDGGIPFFADLPLRARAVASDQIVGAARAIEANLVEARLHESNHAAHAADGFGLPATLQDHERAARIGAETVAFFRAIGSTLDCMAALVTGLLRIPQSIRRASFAAIVRLNPADAPSATTRALWSGMKELVDAQAADPPDWLAWTLEMRHALMHRARLLDILVARETDLPPLVLPRRVMAETARDRLRADHHFRRRPWLPDMEHLADQQTRIADAILREPETVTIRGIAASTNELVEACSSWLLGEWPTIEGFVASPVKAWQVEPPRAITFAGFIPDHEMPEVGAMMMSPRDEERVRLAIFVRES